MLPLFLTTCQEKQFAILSIKSLSSFLFPIFSPLSPLSYILFFPISCIWQSPQQPCPRSSSVIAVPDGRQRPLLNKSSFLCPVGLSHYIPCEIILPLLAQGSYR